MRIKRGLGHEQLADQLVPALILANKLGCDLIVFHFAGFGRWPAALAGLVMSVPTRYVEVESAGTKPAEVFNEPLEIGGDVLEYLYKHMSTRW